VVPGSKAAARTLACVGDRVEVSVEVEGGNRNRNRNRRGVEVGVEDFVEVSAQTR
jgi:hypothetical protein